MAVVVGVEQMLEVGVPLTVRAAAWGSGRGNRWNTAPSVPSSPGALLLPSASCAGWAPLLQEKEKEGIEDDHQRSSRHLVFHNSWDTESSSSVSGGSSNGNSISNLDRASGLESSLNHLLASPAQSTPSLCWAVHAVPRPLLPHQPTLEEAHFYSQQHWEWLSMWCAGSFLPSVKEQFCACLIFQLTVF